jgi:osmotically-inducible protein OsmY
MTRDHRLAVLTLTVALSALGCGQQDVDRLARVGRKSAEVFQQATGNTSSEIGQGWQAVRANLDELDLAGRVAARLRWDKSLADARVDVAVTGTAVELKGTIANEDQRARAVLLAQGTAGVQTVTESLRVASPNP